MERRPERLAETLKEEISEVVGFELDDPRLEAVTVTDVVVAEGLRDAKVFVLIRGSEKEIEAAMKALRSAADFVRQHVAMSLSLRHVPFLTFQRDSAEENAARVNELLNKVAVSAHSDENLE